jgi:hypothetical protein
MSRDNTAPFERGSTFYNGATIDTNNLAGVELEGRTVIFEDKLWSATGIKGLRTGRNVVCRIVRNMSGITLFAKQLVQLDPTNPARVTGRTVTLFGEAYPIDEFVPATGVPNGDLFYIVIGGPALCLTPMAGATFNSDAIAAGDIVGAATTNGGSTAAGSTAPAGRVAGILAVNVALTTNTQYNELLRYAHNPLGRAISGRTSGNTNADILVDIGWRRGGGYT